MAAQDLLALAAAVTVMLTALALLGKAVMVGVQGGRRVFRLIDEWAGEPPGPGNPEGRPSLLARVVGIEAAVGAIPAVLARMTAVEARVSALEERTAAVEAQLYPNGGSTLRDSLSRVEAAVVPQPPAATPPGEEGKST